MVQNIDAAAFQKMVLHAAAALNAQKQAINDLNVFPVPDGDTGTNMSLTIGCAAAELKKKSHDTVGQAAQTTADPCLRELYLELAQEGAYHAGTIRSLLEQMA